MGKVKDSNLFDMHDKMDRVNFQSALLSAHIATNLLKAQGLLVFTGSAAVYDGPVNYACAYYHAKSATHALAK